ncbi:MAG TPA: GNAT family N-acetyltransferase [Chthoniobacterales bacterium]
MKIKTELTVGYAHPAYAAALAEFGRPRALIKSGSWILERPIPGASARDAMGCYPLFACPEWSLLGDDLEAIGQDLVSLIVVTDPFGNYTEAMLRRTFNDLVVPFKEHFIVDLQHDLESFVHSHHQRNARKALRELTVERAAHPAEFLDEWNSLYANLIERHEFKGIARFSRESFARQLDVPGLELFRAIHRGKSVGITLWYVNEKQGYYHLAAYDETGYALRASFALFWRAFEYFAAIGLRQLGLGAGSGMDGDGSDGLIRFKRGWSNATRTTFLCGKILNQPEYQRLSETTGMAAVNYFPAYRKGEFL